MDPADSKTNSNPKTEPTIIFFDGVCGLCNWFVDWTIKHDKNEIFRYAPLQGKTAQIKISDAKMRNQLSSVIVLAQSKILVEGAAVIEIFSQLGGSYLYLANFGRALPTFLTRILYRLVAKNRYAIFGKTEACRIPSATERRLFLD